MYRGKKSYEACAHRSCFSRFPLRIFGVKTLRILHPIELAEIIAAAKVMQPWPGSRGSFSGSRSTPYRGPPGYGYMGRNEVLAWNTRVDAMRRHGSQEAPGYYFSYGGGWGGPAGNEWMDAAMDQFMDMQQPRQEMYPGGYF
ncbi:hypothetical protein CBER1_01740 [Cercospora berteroae]|uniref:Uncharacterized protein n=1 Tax=Cercospora berteroae TaxID=357750 RepID=A0A2S6CHB3_9PEZI|nr:hypothetical protein CBER1_01740 [Cercospora berteroae]